MQKWKNKIYDNATEAWERSSQVIQNLQIQKSKLFLVSVTDKLNISENTVVVFTSR